MHSEIDPRHARQDVFAILKSLVGTWEGRYPNGAVDHVTYSLTANGHVLCEDWTMAKGGKALTVYYPDGTRLMAAHYCPIGNFPRLIMRLSDEAGFHFGLHDVANLRDDDQDHQHGFQIKLHDDGTFSRSECYRSQTAHLVACPEDGWYDAAIYHRLLVPD